MGYSGVAMQISANIKLNAYSVVMRAVQEGIQSGLRRSYKHTPSPSFALLAQELENAISLNLSEVIDFDGCQPCQTDPE